MISEFVFTKMKVNVIVSKEKTALGIIIPKQIHSTIIKEVNIGLEDLSNCDGLFTTNRSLEVGVHTADCAPICFSDGEKVTVIHAGLRGLCRGMIDVATKHFNLSNTEIFVGPHLHRFEIKKDSCYEAIVGKFGDKFLSESEGVIIFNFKDAIASCLPAHSIFDLRNTEHELTLPSYRHKRMFGHIITSAQLYTV